jgi:hypothetical protein
LQEENLRALLCLFSLSLFTASCDLPPGDDGADMAESTTCETTAYALDSADAVSPLVGMSANDLLAALASPYAAAATYPDNEAIGQAPAAGSETGLVLTIEYAGGPIAEVDSVLVQGQDEMYVECHPFLAVEVIVGVATDDGAFAESWTGRLTGRAEDVGLAPELEVGGLSLDGIEGSFQIGELESEYALEAGDLELSADLAASGPSGEIVRYYTFTSGDGPDGVAGQTIYRLLAWGEGE